MKKRIIKKILAILAILLIVSTDFFVLGSNIISYAIETNTVTNNKNIEFFTYFKNEKGEKVNTLQSSIKAENLKLYAEVTVKNEGYLSEATLELQNSNFNIKNTILTDNIASINENKVTLKQINAGATAVIELEIEPQISDTLTAETLSKASDLKLTGKYMETSYKGLQIDSTKNIVLDLKPDESNSAELKTSIITNKIFKIEGTNKRIVQLLVKSRLIDNQYPIKQTTINVDVPTLSEKTPEKIEVISLGTMATNGKLELAQEEWKNENGKIEITLKNEDSAIKWNKNAYDEIVVTFIYDESVETDKIEINTASEITVYNSGTKYTATYLKGIENQEPNEIINIKSKINSSDIYKGQLQSNANAQYSTTTELKVTNSNVADRIVITEVPDVFETETNEIVANTQYISTKINKEKMLKILGQNGTISINNKNETITINKDSEVDENGNIIINYQNASNELTITMSKPENTGILEINHTKTIKEKQYTETELKEIKSIKTQNSVVATLSANDEGQTVVENSSKSSLEIKNNITKAEFTVNKDSLSTITENKGVTLGVKLITDGIQYDLYKNPIIRIQLPTSVESLKMNGITPLYADNFKVESGYDNANKVIEIKLKGEQQKRPETAATQIYLQIDLDIKLSKLAASKNDKIVMTYINENATQYEGETTEYGKIEKQIQISAPSGLITMHNSSTYNISGIKGINLEKQVMQISDKDIAKDINFDLAIVNNTGVDAKNVRIVGKLPTSGNKITEEENTLQTAFKGVTAQNATIYYSENAKATTDTQVAENGWTTELTANAKMFLIVLESLTAGSNYTATYSIQLPSPIQKDTISYSQFEVIYDTGIDKNLKETSIIIGFETPSDIKLETGLSAQVGNDLLNNGDTIKAGEVIKYTMTVKNNGAQALENVELKSIIPEGTVYVTPEENYQHSGTTYYTEHANMLEVKEQITSLSAGETFTKTYEVRTKSDITSEKQISNKTIAIYNDMSSESEELTNKIEPSNIRVTIKKLVEEINVLKAGGTMEYMVIVENMSDKDITDLQLQVLSDNFKKTCLSSGFDLYLINDDIPEIINISKISANGNVWFKLEGDTVENAEQVSATAIVKDSNGNTYRSNKLTETLQKVDAKISLTSPQNKENIKEGDIVEYNIEVQNTGSIQTTIEVVDTISEYLEVQAIYVNGELKLQSTETAKTSTYVSKIENDISYNVSVAVGQKTTIKIVTVVKNSTEQVDAKTITNKAIAKINEITKSTSEEVTHILKISSENIKNVVTGKAWLDKNLNGAKDNAETALAGIKVRLYNVATNDYLKDENGTIIETTTNENGEYTFTKIPNGQYIVIFEYDVNEYEPTYYKKDGVDDSINSKVVFKNITINGEEKTYAVTDTINLEDSISNINIGLREKLIFDLQLNKYISRITIQNSKGTKTYDYKNSTFEKIEIHRKQINGSIIILEYTIKVKNNGEITGYINNVKDYLANELTFSSELNPDWYLSGNELCTKKFANEPIKPGEEKEVKLIVTKTMTNENAGVINNRAEIVEAYNEYGISDVNSIPNNNISGENDMGLADVIIAVSTGGTVAGYIILAMINTLLIAIAIRLMIKNRIIGKKRERR